MSNDPKPRVTSPQGRLINHSFFKLDIFDEGGKNEGKPSYKFEMAFDEKDMIGEGTFEDHILDAVMDEWGFSEDDAVKALEDGTIQWYLDGDELKKRREENGKNGDAYEGKIILRGHTIYNKNGDEGPGGVQVYDENVDEIGAVNADAIYRGCVGKVGLTLNPYEDSRSKQKCVSYYLVAFQKTGDGERITSGANASNLFEPVGRKAGGRKSRKG